MSDAQEKLQETGPCPTDVGNRGESSRQGDKAPLIMNATDGPPGFLTMFPELSTEERKMALLYISHPNEGERTARIKRVEIGIEENKLKEANSISSITHDLNKDLSFVFGYKEGSERLQSVSLGGARQTHSARPTSSESSDQSSSFSKAAGCSTGFTVGTSNAPVSGTSSQLKKPRNRPPSWKRRGCTSQKLNTGPVSAKLLDDETEGTSKRKAEIEESAPTK